MHIRLHRLAPPLRVLEAADVVDAEHVEVRHELVRGGDEVRVRLRLSV